MQRAQQQPEQPTNTRHKDKQEYSLNQNRNNVKRKNNKYVIVGVWGIPMGNEFYKTDYNERCNMQGMFLFHAIKLNQSGNIPYVLLANQVLVFRDDCKDAVLDVLNQLCAPLYLKSEQPFVYSLQRLLDTKGNSSNLWRICIARNRFYKTNKFWSELVRECIIPLCHAGQLMPHARSGLWVDVTEIKHTHPIKKYKAGNRCTVGVVSDEAEVSLHHKTKSSMLKQVSEQQLNLSNEPQGALGTVASSYYVLNCNENKLYRVVVDVNSNERLLPSGEFEPLQNIENLVSEKNRLVKELDKLRFKQMTMESKAKKMLTRHNRLLQEVRNLRDDNLVKETSNSFLKAEQRLCQNENQKLNHTVECQAKTILSLQQQVNKLSRDNVMLKQAIETANAYPLSLPLSTSLLIQQPVIASSNPVSVLALPCAPLVPPNSLPAQVSGPTVSALNLRNGPSIFQSDTHPSQDNMPSGSRSAFTSLT